MEKSVCIDIFLIQTVNAYRWYFNNEVTKYKNEITFTFDTFALFLFNSNFEINLLLEYHALIYTSNVCNINCEFVNDILKIKYNVFLSLHQVEKVIWCFDFIINLVLCLWE